MKNDSIGIEHVAIWSGWRKRAIQTCQSKQLSLIISTLNYYMLDPKDSFKTHQFFRKNDSLGIEHVAV